MDEEEIKSPTKWANMVEISSWVGENICEENSKGGHAKLTVIHHCGEDKNSLIKQLEVMIDNIKSDGENFAC